MVEAAGIEPVYTANTNLMMVHDFGFYDMKTIELPRRYLSPGVLPSLGDILETEHRGSPTTTPGRLVAALTYRELQRSRTDLNVLPTCCAPLVNQYLAARSSCSSFIARSAG